MSDAAGATDQSWEAHLIAVAETGDRDAFSRLFAYFAPRVKSYLLRYGSSPSQAEDIAQAKRDDLVFSSLSPEFSWAIMGRANDKNRPGSPNTRGQYPTSLCSQVAWCFALSCNLSDASSR